MFTMTAYSSTFGIMIPIKQSIDLYVIISNFIYLQRLALIKSLVKAGKMSQINVGENANLYCAVDSTI